MSRVPRNGRTSRRAFLLGAAALAAGCRSGGDDRADPPDGAVAPTSASPTGSEPERSATTVDRSPTAAAAGVEPVAAPEGPDLGVTPFGLGVASGDPLPDRVVCWTRLAPQPLDPAAGLPAALAATDLAVVLDVFAEDARATDGAATTGTTPTTGTTGTTEVGLGPLVTSRLLVARAEEAHTVRVDVDGLEPGRWYRYRFRYGVHSSPIGRTRTAPALDAMPETAHLVSASCQHLEYGTYVAHRRIAEEPEVDLVVFLGDAIYESAGTGSAGGADVTSPAGRRHGPEPTDLSGYRARHALYRSDPDLQAAHARAPWIITWDDHEVQNNYAGPVSADPDQQDTFAERRAAAYRAWWEHQPVRLAPPDADGGLAVARSFRWGRLAHLVVLDGRQHRSDQACGDGIGPACDGIDAEERTMLGLSQEAWVAQEFARAAADGVVWTVLANQTALTEMVVRLGGSALVLYDQWDGYPAARQRLLRAARDAGVRLVALTGDLHASVVGDLTVDAAVVGAEFLGSSIATPFARGGSAFELAMSAVPTVRFLDVANRGYARSRIDTERWRTDLRWVGDGTDRTAPVRTGSSWVVDRSSPRARPG